MQSLENFPGFFVFNLPNFLLFKEKEMNHYRYNREITHHVANIAHFRQEHTVPDFTHSATAGRILSLRTHRNIVFFDLHEDGQFIQCAIRRSMAEPVLEYFINHVSRGNIVWVRGEWGTTGSGEVTLFVTELELLSQNLEPIGDLQDCFDEMAGRQMRELDLMLNASSMNRFRQRSQIFHALRHALHEHEFLEVETPILQTVASGAQATPFRTHINALDSDAYLRIAPETYLVRLLAGGMSRIFEIGHTFRNEGISPRHNPEFSMIEFYESYANLEQTITLTQHLIRQCLAVVHEDLQAVPYGEYVLDFTQFHRFTVSQSLMHYLGYSQEDVDSEQFLLQCLSEHRIENTMPSQNIAWLQYLLFEELVEPLLIQPTFITDLPIEASPLAYSEDMQRTHRFELFVAGRELANGFEQNLDYDEQVRRFEFQSQIAGRDNAMEADMQYLNAVRYGLPSLSGCGIGLDRLIMLATNSAHIREVILYPL
jgi:lysyl-tRNA synthetase, class II